MHSTSSYIILASILLCHMHTSSYSSSIYTLVLLEYIFKKYNVYKFRQPQVFVLFFIIQARPLSAQPLHCLQYVLMLRLVSSIYSRVPIGSWSLTIFEIRPLSHPLDGRRDQSKMHIKQITISNFRSFRQQPEIHPFSPGTNAVVGRNGSGKSNLFDAVQFCLMLSSRWHTLRAVSNTIIEERSRGGPRESIG